MAKRGRRIIKTIPVKRGNEREGEKKVSQ